MDKHNKSLKTAGGSKKKEFKNGCFVTVPRLLTLTMLCRLLQCTVKHQS